MICSARCRLSQAFFLNTYICLRAGAQRAGGPAKFFGYLRVVHFSAYYIRKSPVEPPHSAHNWFALLHAPVGSPRF
jgi:hypothetical protein